MTAEELSRFYRPLSDYFDKALSDLMWSVDNFMKGTSDGNIKRIYSSSRRNGRVKSQESVLRKCHREEITAPESIPDSVEDLIGLRIVTSNRSEARALFEFLQRNKDAWFCDVAREPKFTPYTIAERNRYSIATGYQAFHITFVYSRSYHPGTELSRWPVEIQITSQLWEFWANYSRKYFYSAPGAMVQKLLPYTVAIAKALDNAEDLMATTTNLLLGESEEEQTEDTKK